MKIQVSSQKFRPIKRGGKQNHQQEIIISCDVNDRHELMDLKTEDFDISLYIDGKFVIDLSYILAESNYSAYLHFVEDINWQHEWDLANDNSLDDDQQRTDWQDR